MNCVTVHGPYKGWEMTEVHSEMKKLEEALTYAISSCLHVHHGEPIDFSKVKRNKP